MKSMDPSTVESRQQSGPNKLLLAIPLVLIVVLAVWFFAGNPPAASDTMGVQTTSVPQPVASALAVSESDEQLFSVEGGSFYFKPNEIRVKVGQKVKVTLTSVGGMPHDFVIDELNIRTKQIGSGETDVVEFTPDKAGTYEFYCSVGKHRAMGMVGKLIVE